MDVFLATNFMTPVLPRGRVVSIVYDLTPLRLPGLFPRHAAFRRRLSRTLRRSAAVVAISQCTRGDLIGLMGLDPRRVHLIYPGCNAAFSPAPENRCAEVRRRYGIPEEYVLYVGALGRHKNVSALLRAYDETRRTGGMRGALVVVGSPRWGAATLATLASLGSRADVILTGPVPEADLPPLYTAAVCLVFPSLYEGFGLPVLEAMACGTAVIVSNRGALPEVVGHAGIVVDPDDRQALAAAMSRLAEDPTLRRRFGAAGRARAADFSWPASAAALEALLQDVARGGSGHA
jgi:glycosyltransferase involved in cell wall biosynthesis